MRKPQIALDPHAAKALRVWSALKDKDPGDFASEIILAHMPAKVRDALGDYAPITPSPLGEIDITCKPEGKARNSPPKRRG